MSRRPRASGYFRTGYAQDLALIETRTERLALAVLLVALLAFPFLASPFLLDLANQVFLACIGALALMLLTGYAGQVSLGHAGLLAAGAFTVGILFKELQAPFWVTLPAAALVGALLGVVFGLPSLRLRGLYLAVSTLALHFLVVYLGGEYETKRGFSTGIVIDPPSIGGLAITGGRAWYFILRRAAAATLAPLPQPAAQRHGPRVGRHPRQRDGGGGARHRRGRPQAAGLRHQLGADGAGRRAVRLLPRLRLGGGVLAVPVDPVRGDDHHRRHGLAARGAILGAIFVTLFPYVIEAGLRALPGAQRYAGVLFAVNYAAFGAVMILFLVLEPLGLVGIWRRVQTYFLLWPFKHRPMAGPRR